MEGRAHDLLVISDLHLGESLGTDKTEHTLRLERELVAFLDHHRAEPRRWRLVVNGDMIELVGLNVMPATVGILDNLHPHDHHYGLGQRAPSAAAKMRLVIEHHDEVFRAFARFLADGHAVAVVIGNHDVELNWPEVQSVFVEGLVERAVAQGGDPASVRAGFTFHPWFFFERDLAWIEHGHQYDPYCSFEDVLEPATDATEMDPNLGGLLPRYLGPFLRDGLHAAWSHSFFGYLQFWIRQGRRKIRAMFVAYVDVLRRMVEHWRARAPERIVARQARSRERLRRSAEVLGLPEEVLVELAGLARAPVTMGLLRIVRAMMVDRLLLLTAGPLALLLVLLLPDAVQRYAVALVLLPLIGVVWCALLAREPTDPSETMRASAHRIRERVNVPYVVMGHSHRAGVEEVGGGAYLNTGHWVPSDPERAFTHVRIERTSAGTQAELRQWKDGSSQRYEGADRAA